MFILSYFTLLIKKLKRNTIMSIQNNCPSMYHHTTGDVSSHLVWLSFQMIPTKSIYHTVIRQHEIESVKKKKCFLPEILSGYPAGFKLLFAALKQGDYPNAGRYKKAAGLNSPKKCLT